MAEETRSTQFDELKEIVTRTLEKKGVLAKTQAQLRSHLFTALIEQSNLDNSNDTASALLSDENDRITLSLICDFLSFYGLDYTLSLLKIESRICEPSLNGDEMNNISSMSPATSSVFQSKLFDRSQLTAKLSAVVGAQSPKPTQPLLKEIVAKVTQNNPFASNAAQSNNSNHKLQFKPRNQSNEELSSKNQKNSTKSRSTDDLGSSLSGIDFDFTAFKKKSENMDSSDNQSLVTSTATTEVTTTNNSDNNTVVSQMTKNELPPLPPLNSVNKSLPPLNSKNSDSDFDTIGAMLDDISLFSSDKNKNKSETQTKGVTFAMDTTTNDDNSYGDDNDFGSDIVAESDDLQISTDDKSDQSLNLDDNPYAAT